MSIELLDCTIRDGGYVNNWKFTDEQVRECYNACSSANVDYMEIGFRNRSTQSNLEKYGSTYFCSEEFINKITGEIAGPKLAVMVTINEFNIDDFVECKYSKIKLVRVLMAYHGGKNGDDSILDVNQLRNGISQINQLTSKGYEVSFNLGRIDKVTNEQLSVISNMLSTTDIKYFTMADTYGSVDLTKIETLVPFVKSLFSNTSIKIGFHAHDNCANGTSKALYSLKYGVECIDGCIMGYGRGSGNAKTELLCMDLNKNNRKSYDFIHLIRYADMYISNYKECTHNQSYNVIYALAGYLGCHVTYAIDIIEKHDKMDIYEIYNRLIKMRNADKHMFYDESLFLKDIETDENKFAIEKNTFKYKHTNINQIKSYNKTYDVLYKEYDINAILSNIYSRNDFIIIDKNVSRLHPIHDSFITTKRLFMIDATETNKNINTVLAIIDELKEINFNKKNKLIVIGGGIVQDIGGFVATLYKRGIDWTFIPTTLLAMTDSSIGGKLGINRTSKNMLGLFNAPTQVIISNYFLHSLSKNDILSGLGESLKLCLIGGNVPYNLFLEHYRKSNFLEIIKVSNNVKQIIIEYDELEKNIRKSLNYGHTFGHAIESASDYSIPHGIAVLYGMYMINKVFHDSKFDEINKLILDMIPENFKGMKVSFNTFYSHLKNDKKNSGNNICFIVLNEIGVTVFKYETFEQVNERLKRVFDSMFINEF